MHVLVHCHRWIFKNSFINFFEVRTTGEQHCIINYKYQNIFKKIKFCFPEEEDRQEMSRDDESSNSCENFVLKKYKNNTSNEGGDDWREGWEGQETHDP